MAAAPKGPSVHLGASFATTASPSPQDEARSFMPSKSIPHAAERLKGARLEARMAPMRDRFRIDGATVLAVVSESRACQSERKQVKNVHYAALVTAVLLVELTVAGPARFVMPSVARGLLSLTVVISQIGKHCAGGTPLPLPSEIPRFHGVTVILRANSCARRS